MNMEDDVNAAPAAPQDELSALAIALLKGVLYREADERLWSALLQLQARVRDYVAVLNLELALDEAEGYAFLRARSAAGDDEAAAKLPRLVARRPLSFPVSLLLALLLAREGLPVLVHGSATETSRVLASNVLEALDIPMLTAIRKIASGEVGFAPTELLNPALKRLLDVRRVVGLRNPGHSVVKLMQPTTGPSVIVASYTHPEYARTMGETFELMGMTALLSRGLEGEVVSDPRRTAQILSLIHI